MTELDGATLAGDLAGFPTNAGEFAARWNDATPAQRDDLVSRLVGMQQEANRCFEADHSTEVDRLRRELAAVQKHHDAILHERVILSGAVDEALRQTVHDRTEGKWYYESRLTVIGTALQAASDEIERLGRKYRGESDPQTQGSKEQETEP